jgi:hypothetical protein
MEKTYTLSRTFQWLFILFILLSAFISSAQITITHDDMPTPGTVIIRAMDTINVTNPGGAGLNQTWDFSTVIPQMSDTVDYLIPSDAPGYEMFAGANLAEGRTIYDISGNFYNYIFWNSAVDGMYAIGWNLYFGSPDYTFRSTQTYNPDPNTLPLPLNYGDQSNAATTGERYTSIRVAGILLDSSRIVSNITLNSNVDGSGTIITPVGTYPALRVNEVSNHVDSTFTWDMVNGWEFTRTETFQQTMYRWFANTFGEVATLSSDGESNQFQYLSSIIISVPHIETLTFNIYPNPAGDELYLQTDEKITSAEIFTLNGQSVSAILRGNAIDVSKLEPGIYFCKVTTRLGVSTQKFVKE